MFDSAVFASPTLSSEQVQRMVERPHVYLLAMAADTVDDKLLYIPDRHADIQQLLLPVQVDGLPNFELIMRMFKSDNPEQQYELGISQGGKYKCSACGIHTDMYTNVRRCFDSPRLSIADRQQLAIAGVFGKRASRANPMQVRY